MYYHQYGGSHVVESLPPEAGMFASGVQLQPPLYTTQPMCSQGTTTIRVPGPEISVSHSNTPRLGS